MSAEKWAAAVAICSAVCCIVELLVTNTRLERTVRFVLGAFILCVLIMPLKGFTGDFSGILSEIPDSPEFSEDISRQREELLRKEIKVLVEKTLKESGTEPYAVKIDMDIDDSSCISIITAEVTLKRSDAYKARYVRSVLNDKLSIKAKTVIE